MNLFGNKGYPATKDELEKNLLGRGCINMLSTYNVTWDIRTQALGYAMFLKRKRSRKMKGRGCANGHPQQDYVTKEESISPTVSLYALVGSCIMDAMINRKVITVDIPMRFYKETGHKMSILDTSCLKEIWLT